MVRAIYQGGSLISGWAGRRIIRSLAYVLDLTVFVFQALSTRSSAGRRSRHATRRPLVTQIIFTGVDALPVLTLLALTIGVAITSQFLPLAEALGTERQTVDFLVEAVGIHLSSMMTAIIIVGRSGSAMAVDLGSMRRGGEVEALQLLGVDVDDFFIAPRLLATAISQLVLAVYFAALSLFGGVLLSGLLISPHYLDHMLPLLSAFEPQRVLLFVLLNLLFGLIIAGTACYHALRVTRSPTEIPQETQKAIVNSLIMIFLVQSALVLAGL